MALRLALKSDFHMHTKDDPIDFAEVKYSAEELIDLAHKKGFEVLSITCHDKIVYSPYLREYAEQRGILLIPGVEVTIEGKHVLLINYLGSLDFKSVKDLARIQSDQVLIMAAHPFFPGSLTLKERLVDNIKLFDAIEYCHFYHRFINFNKKAVEVSKQYQKPLVGTSDAHFLTQLDHTYSIVEVTRKTAVAVVEAIKSGNVRVVTKPLPIPLILYVAYRFGRTMLK